MTEFIETTDCIQDIDLDAVEISSHFKLPLEFRQHYLRANGGQPRKGRVNWLRS
jgi:hypothetical protein